MVLTVSHNLTANPIDPVVTKLRSFSLDKKNGAFYY